MAAEPKAKTRVAPPRRFLDTDYWLVLSVVALIIIGLMMVFSATFDWSYQQQGSTFTVASRQFLWAALGLVAMVVVALVPCEWLRRAAVPVLGVTVALLILVLLIGDDVFGARRSFLSGSVQPSEVAKIGMIIYVAAWLSSKGEQVRDLTYGLFPYAVLVGLVAYLIVLQPDMSSAILIVLIGVIMFFFAGADIFQLSVAGIISTVTFFILIKKLDYARQRLDDYMLIWRDPENISYHIRQSLIALGSGGCSAWGWARASRSWAICPPRTPIASSP